jgi:hypothetical protein
MKDLYKALVVLMVFISVSGFSDAKNYYCSPGNGSMSNPGTKGSPWPSLQDVMASGVKLNPGDTLLLISGDHGFAGLQGINPNYIYILAAPGENPVIRHLDIAKSSPTIKWHIEGITFSGTDSPDFIKFYPKSMYVTISKCTFITAENTGALPVDEIKSKIRKGISIEGSRHEITFNTFSGISTALDINADKCKISGNRISDFTEHAILCKGSNNVFTNNLIKNFVNTGFNAAAFKALSSPDKPSSSNIILGNVIVDYTSPDRDKVAPLMGIVGFDGNYTKWIIENNIVVTDHWHGITFFNITNSEIVNNTVIDPYLDTKYPNLSEDLRNKSFGPVRIWISKTEKGAVSSGNVTANNLASDYFIEDAEGVNTNNIKVASLYGAMDNYFMRWDYLDFHLRDSALAVNAGNNDYAPGIDADGTKRPLGSAVNAGAYEYSYVEPGDQTIEVYAEKNDVELRNHGQKADWNGQKTIRMGGVGAGFDGVMVMPFALPPLPDGFRIKSASLSVNLEKIDNSPMGVVNLHGLIPRKSPEVIQSDYYQGDIMGDQTARPIQQDLLGRNKGGKITTSAEGDKVLTNYLNALYESGAVGGDYLFLRLSPSSTDVKDYSRWVFSSADADNFNDRPVLNITIGKEEKGTVSEPEHLVIVSPDALYDGSVKIILAGFAEDNVEFEIFDDKNISVLKDHITNNTGNKMVYNTNAKIKLRTGIYYLKINGKTQKFNVW